MIFWVLGLGGFSGLWLVFQAIIQDLLDDRFFLGFHGASAGVWIVKVERPALDSVFAALGIVEKIRVDVGFVEASGFLLRGSCLCFEL